MALSPKSFFTFPFFLFTRTVRWKSQTGTCQEIGHEDMILKSTYTSSSAPLLVPTYLPERLHIVYQHQRLTSCW
ncbi:hypothetical protein CI102_8954 [Trichoderma harzianum]|nr:hypothetical protein CI102_8954 [Trichoderma harzianum]